MKLIQPVRNGLKEIRQKKTSIRPVSVSAAKMREGGKVAAGDLLCHPSPGAGFWGCKWSHSLHLHFHSHWFALPLPLPALLQFLPACVAHSHEWDVTAPQESLHIRISGLQGKQCLCSSQCLAWCPLSWDFWQTGRCQVTRGTFLWCWIASGLALLGS